VAQRRKTAFQISYVTITYRSVMMGALAVLSIAAIVTYFAFPDFSNRIVLSAQFSVERLLTKLGVGGPTNGSPLGDPGPQQAHFTNIDGIVRVKKASSNTWVTADYSLALDRNDVVQTSAEGIAKVAFTDGTSYTVKPDSLIVIQENSLNAAQQTKVAVQVTTGTVDLATQTLGHGSRSQVTVEGAVATLNSDTSAEVVNDPRKDQHEILVKKGTGEVSRGDQTVTLAEYEKVNFRSDDKQMAKTKEIRPPFLISPHDKDTYQVDPKSKEVTLTWGPVDGVRAYRVQLSKSKFFSGSLLLDQKNWPNLEMNVKGLEPGLYYWQVFSVGDDGKQSIASPPSSFNVVPKGADVASIPLELDAFSQHGHLIEITGHTEPGARVMVNGQEAVVTSDGGFHHFTNFLPTGDNYITITAQNQKGGVNTRREKVTIQ
jgi:hypothetical protein